MGSQFWSTESTAQYAAPLNALLIGVANATVSGSSAENPKPIPGELEEGVSLMPTGPGDVAAQSLVGLGLPTIAGAGPKYEGGAAEFSDLYDFGAMRAAGLAWNSKRYKETDTDALDEGVTYVMGPWRILQDELSTGWGGGADIASALATTRPTTNDFTLTNNPVYSEFLDALSEKAAAMVEKVFSSTGHTGTFEQSWDAVETAPPSLLDDPELDTTSVPAASDLLTDVDWSEPTVDGTVTFTPPTVSETVDWAAPEVSETVDWSAPTVSETVDWSAPEVDTTAVWTAPDPADLSEIVDWEAPVINVEADIVAAVNARRAIEELAAAQEKSAIRAQYYGTRSMLSDQISPHLKLVDDRMEMRLAEYEQSLRMGLISLKADTALKITDMELRKATGETQAKIDTGLRIADLTLRKSTSELDARTRVGLGLAEMALSRATAETGGRVNIGVRMGELGFQKSSEETRGRLDAALKLAAMALEKAGSETKTRVDSDISIADMTLRHATEETRNRVTTGVRFGELGLQKATTSAQLNTETSVNRARMVIEQRASLNQLILNLWNMKTTAAQSIWEEQLRSKVNLLISSFQHTLAAFGSGDSVARVLTSMVEAELRESMFRRSQEGEWKQYGLASANAISNAVVAMADARNKSMMQNLNTLRDAVSVFSVAPSYTQTQPSPFQNTMNVLGGVTSLVSAGINMGVALH